MYHFVHTLCVLSVASGIQKWETTKIGVGGKSLWCSQDKKNGQTEDLLTHTEALGICANQDIYKILVPVNKHALQRHAVYIYMCPVIWVHV